MPELYIGLMSGTSADAIDAALLDFEPPVPKLLATQSLALAPDIRRRIRTLDDGPRALRALGQLDTEMGELFAEASLRLIRKAGVSPKKITAIGSHGHTVYHHPHGDHPFSMQIGDPNVITVRTGICTVADFRRRDVAAGGQGAPLLPAYHALLLRTDNEDRAVVNIGGIANLTVLPRAQEHPILGFDTGPGNTLLDAWVARHRGTLMDENGAWAADGKVDKTLLSRLLGDDYFTQAPPKSTGPEYFNLAWLDGRLSGRPVAEDVQATLAALTAKAVADAVSRRAASTERLLVCGGGVHNTFVLHQLADALPGCLVESTAAHGVDPDWIEACAFAWFAKQTLEGRPGNLPSVTGAERLVVLGGIYRSSEC
ncbi:MAG: anhydro-N-acetylmuramic acid kinase [Gammaproteobacteria bacterium]